MAFGYRPVDRDQLFLVPPDMRQWLPEGHLVWLVLDVVERIDTSGLHKAHPNVGVGRRAYDPDMLLALLLYAYCTGQRSSRHIERLCEVDVAYRVICANDSPDHSTIARFRQVHQDHAEALFVEVLVLCGEAGLARVGVVAVDGTKMAGDASLKANHTLAHIEAEVAAMMREAEAVDVGEDELFGGRRGDEMPVGMSDRSGRRQRLDAAVEQLKAKRAARDRARAERAARNQRAVAEGRVPRAKTGDPVVDAETRLAAVVARAALHRERVEARAAAQGRRPHGRPPGQGPRVAAAREHLAKVQAEAATKATTHTKTEAGSAGRKQSTAKQDRANTTDPDSRVMPTKNGWLQGYNAQAAVNDNGVVLAADVTNEVNDTTQFEPMTAGLLANLGAIGADEPVGTMLFDAGYFSEHNATVEGPDRLIATTKSWKHRQQLRDRGPTSGPPPQGATPAEAMEHRLRTPQGSELYKKRQHTVEPVFGQIKEGRGIRRFARRGLNAVQAEWQLITMSHNVLKLANSGYRPA